MKWIVSECSRRRYVNAEKKERVRDEEFEVTMDVYAALHQMAVDVANTFLIHC